MSFNQDQVKAKVNSGLRQGRSYRQAQNQQVKSLSDSETLGNVDDGISAVDKENQLLPEDKTGSVAAGASAEGTDGSLEYNSIESISGAAPGDVMSRLVPEVVSLLAPIIEDKVVLLLAPIVEDYVQKSVRVAAHVAEQDRKSENDVGPSRLATPPPPKVSETKSKFSNIRWKDVPTLQGSDSFLRWKVVLEAILVDHQLLHVIKDGNCSPEENKTVLKGFHLTVHENIVDSILLCETAMEAFNKLSTRYDGKDAVTVMKLRKELTNMTLSSGRSLAEHVNKFEKLFTRLEQSQQRVPEIDRMTHLLSSLNEDHLSFVQSQWNPVVKGMVSWEELVKDLFSHETLIRERRSGTAHGYVAMAANPPNRRGRPKPTDVCRQARPLGENM